MCPLEYVTEDVWSAIAQAKMLEKGLAPVAGGSLDQAQSFLEACRWIWGEQAYWRQTTRGGALAALFNV